MNSINKDKCCTEIQKNEFKCIRCEKVLSSKRNLEVHIGKCKGKDKFKCKFCNKILSTKRNLDSHLICCSEKKK